MLVLSRRIGEKIVIGDGIVVTVVEVHRDSVRLGVDAPRSVPVNRAELVQAVSEENVAALNIDAAALTSLRDIKPRSTSPLDLRKLMHRSTLTQAAPAAPKPAPPVTPVSGVSSASSADSAAPAQGAAVSPESTSSTGNPNVAVPKPKPIPKPRDPRL